MSHINKSIRYFSGCERARALGINTTAAVQQLVDQGQIALVKHHCGKIYGGPGIQLISDRSKSPEKEKLPATFE